MKKTVLILAAIIFCLSGIHANEPEITDKKSENIMMQTEDLVLRDVPYGESPRQKLDVFLPDGRSSRTKVVLLIPGGGWIGGDKGGFEGAATVFADSSIAAFTMNYRYANISDGVTYVEMLADIDSAISFIISKSDEYIFDPEQICLFGHSAGAHLALLYTYRNNDNRVNNVVSLAGPSDLRDPVMLSMPTGIMTIFYSLMGNMDVCTWEDAGPINHVNAITSLLYHGTEDEIIPYHQSEVLFNKIKDLNPKNRLDIIEGGGHGFASEDMTRAINETVELIK